MNTPLLYTTRQVVAVKTFMVLVAMLLFSYARVDAAVYDTIRTETYDTISHKIHFKRSRTKLMPYYMDNAKQLASIKQNVDTLQDVVLVIVRVIGSASPEGYLSFNTFLATERAASMRVYLERRYPKFFTKDVPWEVKYEYEDWSHVVELLKVSNLKHREEAIDIIENTPYIVFNKHGKRITTRKTELKKLYGGTVWREMDRKIFPYSRGAELLFVVRKPHVEIVEVQDYDECEVDTLIEDTTDYTAFTPAPTPVESIDTLVPYQPAKTRQPMLAVKTNLLFYGAYLPKYGWCPIPNIGLEFLPKHGHWTVGASLDIPWWKHYDTHKFFQIRNWQIEGRRYFSGDAQYWGWYAQAYIHTGVFGIGFNKNEGWEGESVGGGVGGGYVLPLTKGNHLKLEFNLQIGYMRTMYDPYVYGHPTNGLEDGLYYYNWTHDPDLFKERQYRHNWFGPTRVGVTLSYDLLYYPRKKTKKKL